jgi:hypothetical protein
MRPAEISYPILNGENMPPEAVPVRIALTTVSSLQEARNLAHCWSNGDWQPA